LRRWEAVGLGLCFASWVGALLNQIGALSLPGVLDLGLYPLYSLAAALGWVLGNTYLHRRRTLYRRARRRILPLYLLAPPGVLYLLRSLAPVEQQRLAPLVPLLAFAVYVVFFLVPLSLAGEWSRPPDE
jgi:hypothetical protein